VTASHLKKRSVGQGEHAGSGRARDSPAWIRAKQGVIAEGFVLHLSGSTADSYSGAIALSRCWGPIVTAPIEESNRSQIGGGQSAGAGRLGWRGSNGSRRNKLRRALHIAVGVMGAAA